LVVRCNHANHNAIFPRLVTARLFPVSTAEKCSERTTILKLRKRHCKSDESTGRSIEEWFPRMIRKDFRFLAKMIHCPRYGYLFLCNKPIPGNFEASIIVPVIWFREYFSPGAEGAEIQQKLIYWVSWIQY
jgi:hypothetical protein